MLSLRQRIISGILAAVFIFDLIDGRTFSGLLKRVGAYAAESDYSVGFYWDTSALGDNNGTERSYSLSNGDTVLDFTENSDENPILKTTFSFNLAKAIEKDHLEFTITGLDKLIRNGTLTLDMNDPNLVGTWDITKDAANDVYTFRNKVRVTSNNETTFTWQFASRDAINGSDIQLDTKVKILETETYIDDEGNPAVRDCEEPIEIDTNSLNIRYHSECDENDVKIVCKDINETDFNNLNSSYDWRSYYSVVGLKGMEEYTKSPVNGGVEYTGENQLYDAHYVIQGAAMQEDSAHARGVSSSDYFIEVDPGEFSRDDIMVVNSAGNRVELKEYNINGKTLWGFYDFRGRKRFLPGESYGSEYRVGVLNSAITSDDKSVQLTGHFLITYNDDPSVVELTDDAAHKLSIEDPQPVSGGGGYINKYNDYEINNGVTYDGHYYQPHSKHYSALNQLLYDGAFNGKEVTYRLSASTPQAKDTSGNALAYDLIYEDGAPQLQNLLNTPDRYLAPEEYDFRRILIKKLIDGETVKNDPDNVPVGFDYVVYGKCNDPESAAYGVWQVIDTGNTGAESTVYFPEGIDEIKLVVKDLYIRADVGANVTIAYKLDPEEYTNIYIDTENYYEADGSVKENTNHGSRLVNTYSKKQYVGRYDVENDSTYTYKSEGSAHSNTWFRDSVTTVDSIAAIEEFEFHNATEVGQNSYYSTNITAGGTIQSDNQKALKHFAVYSVLPENVTPDEEWLTVFRDSLKFSSSVLGDGTPVDAEFLLANNAVSVYYDESKNCIVAEVKCDGFSLDSSAMSELSFSYPADITLSQLEDYGTATAWFKTTTYVTVLDDNVKLAAVERKTLVTQNDALNPTGRDASKTEARVSLSSRGSQKSNYTKKYVCSSYTKWRYENSAEVDGSNTEHIDTTRTGSKKVMTSDYSYKLVFNRLSTDENETVSEPLLIDITEGLQDSAWHGTLKSITFDTNSYPVPDYVPEVYYLKRDKAVENVSSAEYKYGYAAVDDTISHFNQYKDGTGNPVNYSSDLDYYSALKNDIRANWTAAVKDSTGAFQIEDGSEIYAVAIIFAGQHVVGPTKEMQLSAYMNMTAPELINDSTGNATNNNRASFNNTHVFAEGLSSTGVQFPMYSLSNTTMLTLRHNVQLMKVSASDKTQRLSGAAFDVFNGTSSGNIDDEANLVQYYKKGKTESIPMKDMEVDLSGILQMNLAPGIYYYKETRAPAGYELDDRLYRFRASADKNSVYYYMTRLVSASDLASEYMIVNNKEYDIYRDSIYAGKTPVDDNEAFRIYDDDGNEIGFLLYDDDNGQYVYDIENGSADDKDIRCTAGRVTVYGLEAGSYIIGKSFTDPNGYSFSIADESAVTFMLFRKSAMTSGMQYHVREMTGPVPAGDDPLCTFTGSNGNYSFEGTAEGTVILVPDSSGKLTVTGLDSGKRYYIENVEAPVGYRLAENHIIAPGSSNVEFYSMEDLERHDYIVAEDAPIGSAMANFMKIDGTVYDPEDPDNTIVPLEGAEYQMYLLEDDGSESLLYFSENSGTGIYKCQGTSGSSSYKSVLKSRTVQAEDGNGNAVSRSGFISVRGLSFGTYVLREIKAPDSYQLSDEAVFFYVTASTIDENGYVKFADESGSEPDNTTDTLLLKDDEVLSSLVLTKADAVNEENYLGNAIYYLYKLQPNTDSSVTSEDYLSAAKAASILSRGLTSSQTFTKYWGEEPERTLNIDSGGKAIAEELPFGTYLLYEFLAPAGYKWNNDINKWETWAYTSHEHEKLSQVVVIDQDTVFENKTVSSEAVADENGNPPDSPEWHPTYAETINYHEFYAKHLDERKEGETRLIKRNEDQLGLNNAVFALYQVRLTDAELAGVLDKTESEVSAMSEADKQLALSKLELSVDDIDFDSHFDFAEGAPRTDGSGKPIDKPIDTQMKTNGDKTKMGATVTKTGLEWGIYYYYEVKAPSGYQADSTPYFFAVDSDSVGTLIEAEVSDEKTFGEIWMYKQAKEADAEGNHTKLFGAQFDLYHKDGGLVYSIPMLRLTGAGIGNRVKLFVKKAEVLDKKHIRFVLIAPDDGSQCILTAEYAEDADGTVLSLTPNETFINKYGSDLVLSDFRLSYYVVSADEKSYYDDDRGYIPFKEEPAEPVLPDNYSSEEYEEYQQQMSDYHQALSEYYRSELIKSCMTHNYITADSGGRLNVRGLDWDSYYFRETVPPEGYGLADDVVFTVNAYNCDNQFIPCEDPPAQAGIIIDKEIPDPDYFDAFGEPTFMYKVYGLRPAETGETADYTKGGTDYVRDGRTYTLSIHLTKPNTKGSAMVNVPAGQYLIEELPVSRYECYDLEMVTGNNVKVKSVSLTTPTSAAVEDSTKHDINGGDSTMPWTAFCDLTGADSSFGEMLAFHVKYSNRIKRYDHFSEVSYADNQIPEREFVTAFKPIYIPLIPVEDGDSYTYEIDLAEALANGDFEAALSYNTEKIKELTADELSKVKFSSNTSAPVTNVSFDGTILRITVADPASAAGQSISLNAGYSDDPDFTVYDEQDTSMVRGSLELTFSDIQADTVKKVILKNDVSNLSYFPRTEGAEKDTSVAVLYTRPYGGGDVTRSMQIEGQTADITPADNGHVFAYWYLLDPDGRPVLDKNGDIIQFTMEEIETYIFDGTWPAYMKAGTAESLLPATLENPANVANISSFTFQAELLAQDKPTAMFIDGNSFRTFARRFAGNTWSTAVITQIIYSPTPPTENGMTKYVLPSKITGNYGNTTNYTAVSLTKPGENNGVPDFENYDSYNSDYPNVIYMWSVGTVVYWYTDDPTNKAMLNYDSSWMFAEMDGINNGFVNTGLDHMCADEVVTMSHMFYCKNTNTKEIPEINLDSWKTPNLTNLEYMFFNLRGLRNISWENLDTSNVTTMNSMLNCVGLYNIDFLADLNTDKLTDIGWFINPQNGSTLNNQASNPNMLDLVSSWSSLDSLTESKEAFRDCWIRNKTFTTTNGSTYKVEGNGSITKIS